MKKNILKLFVEQLLEFPLWIKQIVFLRLHQNLSKYLSEDFITTKEDSLFHLYIPTISFAGRTEITERKSGHDANIYIFLENVSEGMNMIEIAINNFWTMEEVAKYFTTCLEQSYFKTPDSIYVYAISGYMAGKLRIGEFFKRIGKIDVYQLEQAIITQMQSKANGTNLKMAEILISQGLITEKDTSSLLTIKDEAKKRFILNPDIIPKAQESMPDKTQFYEEEIARLTEKNRFLKEQLNKVLAFVKKNG